MEHSYHIFYFPFKWRLEGETRKDFSCVISLDNIHPAPYSHWKNNEEPDEEEQQQLYNEKNYFYEFVHPVLYDTHTPATLVKHFEREEPQHTGHCFYRIAVNGRVYELEVDAVNLNFYATGVGTLSFYLRNNRYAEPDDILYINQYGRRVFPPFYADISCKIETAGSLSITGLAGDSTRYYEDFSTYEHTKKPWLPARFIRSLIADLQPGLEITPVIDDRMFVNCWYENDGVAKKFYYNSEEVKAFGLSEKEICCKQFAKLENFIYYDPFWYKYLYVDAGTHSCTDIEMRKRLIDESTYTRWQHAGTLFGCTRYSLMLLTNVDFFPRKVLAIHMRSMYSRMIELVLVQRASMLKFSEEVTRVSSLAGSSEKEVAFRIGTLYKEYIRFINQMFFRDITAQDQGIELYTMLMERFKSDRQIKDLDDEIGELHQYITLLIDNNRNAQGSWLNLVATLFLPGAFLSGIFGMNPFRGEDFSWEQFGLQCVIIAVCTLVIGVILNYKKYE